MGTKLKEKKENQGGMTKVVHENNGMKVEYYELKMYIT